MAKSTLPIFVQRMPLHVTLHLLPFDCDGLSDNQRMVLFSIEICAVLKISDFKKMCS